MQTRPRAGLARRIDSLDSPLRVSGRSGQTPRSSTAAPAPPPHRSTATHRPPARDREDSYMAMAPEQAGIGIRRHFTTEGAHPYDEVELGAPRRPHHQLPRRLRRLRAARRRVPRRLVAQRHQHRRPEVLPRHPRHARAGVVAAPGRSTGWSTPSPTGAPAAATSSTTTRPRPSPTSSSTCIVTQKAAFNSPVWFNIGVKGVPQQASACFILAVDDTMDSILNWYVEEGTIFKGGSGSGINLSQDPLVASSC